ncbi:MAG: acyl carrier protein [Nitrospinae bacterium]|nr:acyl carrier protein [Nitrospinota bacterium]
MTNKQIFEKTQDVFREIFDQPGLVIQRSTSANDLEEWDSLNHINLVVSIEKEFGIKFALGELETLKDVGGMLDLIHRKLTGL